MSIHKQILLAKQQQSDDLTAEKLDKIALKVCVECGIKDTGLPSIEVINLCLKSWEDKFKGRMNIHEIELAFEMNINGDLKEKVNHFQCFSREFFCDVLIKYLSLKQEEYSKVQQLEDKEQQLKALPEPDISKQVLQRIIDDFKSYHNKPDDEMPLMYGFTITTKLEYLYQMFDMKVTDITIIKLRDRARSNIIAQLSKKMHQVDGSKKPGVVDSALHEIARLKTGKLLNQSDEAKLQSEVSRLMYLDAIKIWKPSAEETIESCEFVNHIKSNMEL